MKLNTFYRMWNAETNFILLTILKRLPSYIYLYLPTNYAD